MRLAGRCSDVTCVSRRGPPLPWRRRWRTVSAVPRALARDVPISVLLLIGPRLRIRLAAGSRWERPAYAADAASAARSTSCCRSPCTTRWPSATRPCWRARRATSSSPATTGLSASTWCPIVRRRRRRRRRADARLGRERGAARRARGRPRARRAGSPSSPRSRGSGSWRSRAPLEELMDAACRAVAEGLGVELPCLLEHHGDGPDAGARRRRLAGRLRRRRVRAGVLRGRGRPRALRAGPVVIDDLPNDPRWRAPAAARARRRLQRDRARRPPRGAGRRARRPHARRRTFGEQDLDFLRAVAHVLNGAIEGLRIEERIRHDALHDALTGLPNRDPAAERLQRGDRARPTRRAGASRCSSSTSTT